MTKEDTMNATIYKEIRQHLTGVEEAGNGDRAAFPEHAGHPRGWRIPLMWPRKECYPVGQEEPRKTLQLLLAPPFSMMEGSF